MLPTTAPRRSARISARSSRAEGNDPAPSDLLAPAHQSLSSRAAEAESSRHRRREETRRERSDEETPIASRALIDENQTAPRPSVTGRKLTNGTAGQEFTLRITVEPPTEALVNIPLYPPVTVRLEGETVVDGNEDELGSLWAFASLTNEDGSELLSPPRPDLMTGAFANSFHAITLTDGDTTASAEDRPPQTIAGDQRQDRIVSFASFPGIAIREAGRYSIRVTLFRMEVGAAAPASAQGAASLSQVQSRPIYISDSPAVNSVGR
ncbi:MAG: hypothetical protein M1829_001580 [Trizodia sp. TS-e1964]|nr:MAG: hypothetical protein M1829_001580 [Trizodia sp. TS-e1964]